MKNDIIDIKSTMSISEIIENAPFDLTTRENVLELVGLIREVFAAIHSTPMIFVSKISIRIQLRFHMQLKQ